MAKYQIIKDWIQKSIDEGKYTSGERLPSESEFMGRFKVSRHTVRKAFSDLIAVGILEARQGSGVFFVGKLLTKRRRISFITFTADSYIFPGIIKGVYEELFKNDADLILHHSNYQLAREALILENLRQDQIDGIIITPCFSGSGGSNLSLLEAIRNDGIPVVLLDNYFPAASFPIVGMDDFAGGRKAAKYIFQKGHRTLGILYAGDHYGMVVRKNGAIAFMKEQGIIPDEAIKILTMSLGSLDDSEERILEFLREKKETAPTALFCANDQIALITINAALSLGFKIPDDLSIIGFDNSDISKISRIPLTTINHPKETIGRVAAQFLLNELSSKDGPLNQKSFTEPVLIERGSVASIISE